MVLLFFVYELDPQHLYRGVVLVFRALVECVLTFQPTFGTARVNTIVWVLLSERAVL